MIFTPEWVGARLFHQEEVETQIALLPIFPVIYRHHDVVLEASGARLIFRPRFNSAQSLEMAERMAWTVLDDLPNTPLNGVGINFSFVERNPPQKLLELFNFGDDRPIERAGWEASEAKVSRKLTGQHGIMLLSLMQEPDGIAFEFNFHTDTPGTTAAANEAAKQAVTERVVKLRDAALDFSRDIYKLKLEEG
jgi:hypothetical protein